MFRVSWVNEKNVTDTRQVDAAYWRAREDFIEFYNSGGQAGAIHVWSAKKDRVIAIETVKS